MKGKKGANSEVWPLVLSSISDARQLARFSLVSKSSSRLGKRVPKVSLELDPLKGDEVEAIRSTLKSRVGLVELEIVGKRAPPSSKLLQSLGLPEMVSPLSSPSRSTLSEMPAAELMSLLLPSSSTLAKLVLMVRLGKYKGFLRSISSSFTKLEYLEASYMEFLTSSEMVRMSDMTIGEFTAPNHLRVLKVWDAGNGSIENMTRACPKLQELVAHNADGGPISGGELLTVRASSSVPGVMKLDPGCLPLTSLRALVLNDIRVSAGTLETLLKAAPHLETLRVCLDQSNDAYEEQPDDGPDALVRDHSELREVVLEFMGVVSVENCSSLTSLTVKYSDETGNAGMKLEVSGCGRLKELKVERAYADLDETSVMELETLHLTDYGSLDVLPPAGVPNLRALLVTGYGHSDIHKKLLSRVGSRLADLIDENGAQACTGVAEWIGKPVRKVTFFRGEPDDDNDDSNIESPKEDELLVEFGADSEQEYVDALVGLLSKMMEKMPDVEEICVSKVFEEEGEDDDNEDDDDDNGDDDSTKVRLRNEVRAGFQMTEDYGKGQAIFRRVHSKSRKRTRKGKKQAGKAKKKRF